MAVVKRIVCLANSRKLSGRCIAGIELSGPRRLGWIRPVSVREHEEVSEYERQYRDGSDPRVLDVMNVPLLDARPKGYQQENWLLDPEHYWQKIARMAWSDLGSLADPAAPLWINGHSTYNGQNDRIPLAQAAGLTNSLRLLRVDRLKLTVFKPGEAFGNPKRRLQAIFAVFTIGHSTHTIEAFVGLLRTHSITAVSDVRSTPFSRFNPQFNKEALEKNLRSHGIKYVFLGRELGARSDDRACYENGRVRYERLARTDLFHQGIERVVRGSEAHRIALMCAEKDPLECHRTLLVSRALYEQGFAVAHILGNGCLESHSDAMERLLDVTGLPREDLFRSREELIAQALTRQEARVAFVNETTATEAPGETR